ncbi:hypothetical protein PRIC2_004116 [Phytophthora ramorum]
MPERDHRRPGVNDELFFFHEALGSDDEQAAEDELCARVLYSFEDGDRLLQSLHLVQGLLAFVRGVQTNETTPQWASVTLSKRRFFILEVEPKIFMALGVHPTVEIKAHRFGYEALLREMYGMFRLFHGSIDSNLRWLPPVKSDATSITGKYEDGMDLLMGIARTRKRLRKLRLAIDSHTHNQLLDDAGGQQDDNVMARLQDEKMAVEAELEVLVAHSPVSILQRKCADFFPTLLQALDARGTKPGVLNAASLERLEDYLDSHQRFQDLAQLIFTRYSSTFAPEKSIPNLRPLPPFLYINRVNLAFRIQHVPRLLKSKEDDLFPVPVKLLAHYFPASTLALVNDLHAELHRSSNVGNREICVRTRHAGWVLAKKSETSHRELYVFFDSKISSVYDLSDSLQMLLHDQFGNVLF